MAQGLPVYGYKDQSDDTIATVNQNKIIEEQVLRMIDAGVDSPDIDQRWLEIARTRFEEAFMALNRAILRPQRVALEEVQHD